MCLRQLLVVCALSSAASLADASTYTIMFERNSDTTGQELAFLSYDSYADLLTHTGALTTFSPINVAANFTTTGLMFDGTRYTLMFERNSDTTGGQELAFLTYDSYDNLLSHTGALTTLSPINVAANFTSTGLMFDGTRYTLMFERDTDAAGGQELAFLTYDSYDNLLSHTGGLTTFSPINVAANFTATGLMYDGTRYTLMFERDTDAAGGLELAFLSYDSYDNLLGNIGALTTFSPINVAANFTSTGLMYGGALPPPDPGGDPRPAVIPLPASLWMVLGALGLLGLRGRPWRCPPPAA